MAERILRLILLCSPVIQTFAFDLCLLFGACPNNNNFNNNRNINTNSYNYNARSDPGVIVVDQDWIEPKNSDKNVLYHFATTQDFYDWYAADTYCSQKGGYLAEPQSDDEHNFIVSQARQYPQSNWWIGLRSVEDCQCLAGKTDTKSTIEADIDFDSLVDSSSPFVPVKTKCPPDFEKICKQPIWRWGYSSIKMGFSRWNVRTGEPNSDLENCAALWFEQDYNWSDWGCSTSRAGPHPFKPVCQKDKDFSGITGKRAVQDPISNEIDVSIEEDPQSKVAPLIHGPLKCLEYDVVYKSSRVDVVNTILRVHSADLCRSYCAEDAGCRYWTWFGHGPKHKCILKEGLKGPEFRTSKIGAVSGTILNECRPDKIPTPETPPLKLFDLGKIYFY